VAPVDLAALDLKTLFCDERMFVSRRAWSAAGFRVSERADNGKIMVAAHPSVPGLLFKKYNDDTAQRDQEANYRRRIEGAGRLRAFVDRHLLRRVIIPRKRLLELPHPFSRRDPSHILVVERLDLLSDEQTRAAYYGIDPGILQELCVVLFHFRGMDSSAKNVPFVTDGRIAFIDTEHWDRASNKAYLHQVGEHLSVDRRKLAKKIFDRLKDGADGPFEGGSKCFDEEDTSSASSSSSSSSY
jgi:hypothetical protein